MRPLTLKELQAINKKLRAELRAAEIDLKTLEENVQYYKNLSEVLDEENKKLKSHWVYKFSTWFNQLGK